MKQRLTKQQVIAYRSKTLADAAQYGPTTTARLYSIHRDTIYAWKKIITLEARSSWSSFLAK